MKPISAKVFYLGIVFFILGVAVSMGGLLIYIAATGDGPQIIDNYYQKSVGWNEFEEVRDRSQALGWQLQWKFAEDGGTLRIQNAQNEAIVGLNADIYLKRPQDANEVLVGSLRANSQNPGEYRIDTPLLKSGYWDLRLDGTHDGQSVLFSSRHRIQL